MQTLLLLLEKISSGLGRTMSYLLLLMVMVTVSVVIIRYVFQSGSIMLQESITYLHASVVILVMGYCLQNNAHVRVDIFYRNLTQKKQALVNTLGTIFLLIPFCIFVFWICFPYVQRSWSMLEKSADAGGIPGVFLLKTLLLMLSLVLIFQALIELIRNGLILCEQDIGEDQNNLSNKIKEG